MNEGDQYIGAGVKADCEKLLNNFLAKKSLRFDSFVEVWKSMSFSLIFSGRETMRELVEFTEEVLQIGKAFIFPPYSLSMRAGGIFLTAGLYFKQPATGKVKIRITKHDLKELKLLLEQLRQEGHYDVICMFCKMLKENAFHFTLSPRKYGIELNIRKYLLHNVSDINSINALKDEESPDEEEFVQETFVSDLLQKTKFFSEIQEMDQRYNRMKTLFYGDTDGGLPKSLSYAYPNLLKAMQEAVNPKASNYEKESSKKMLKKEAFKKISKTRKMKDLEVLLPEDVNEKVCSDNSPGTSKGKGNVKGKKSVVDLSKEWQATENPRSKKYIRKKLENQRKEPDQTPTSQPLDEPCCSVSLPTL